MWKTYKVYKMIDINNPFPLEEITTLVKEEYDRFIFKTIQPWCQEITRMTISKEILNRALICYQNEHKEEYEELLKKMGEI